MYCRLEVRRSGQLGSPFQSTGFGAGKGNLDRVGVWIVQGGGVVRLIVKVATVAVAALFHQVAPFSLGVAETVFAEISLDSAHLNQQEHYKAEDEEGRRSMSGVLVCREWSGSALTCQEDKGRESCDHDGDV